MINVAALLALIGLTNAMAQSRLRLPHLQVMPKRGRYST
jgi:hypothetical protein